MMTFASFLAAIALSGQSTDVSELTGITWRLAAIEPSDEETLLPVASAVPTIAFTREADEEGRYRMNGFAGCNRFFGGYTTGPERTLTVPGPLGATRMACPEPIDRIESAFLDALEKARSYEVDESELRIRFETGLLRFTRGAAAK